MVIYFSLVSKYSAPMTGEEADLTLQSWTKKASKINLFFLYFQKTFFSFSISSLHCSRSCSIADASLTAVIPTAAAAPPIGSGDTAGANAYSREERDGME